MSHPKQLPLDPKQLMTLAAGFGIGVLIMVFFVLLATGLHLPLYVDHGAIPHQ
jgi:hypothetical protein